MSEASTENSQSQQNHRSVLDDLIGETPLATPPTPTAPVVPEAASTPDTPPAAPAVPEKEIPPANEPPVDVYKGLSEISNGLVTSEEDFRSTIEKAGKFTDLESQLNALTLERDALKNANPFPNEYVKRLAELYSAGADASKIELFQRINSLGDVNQLPSEDAVKWELREKHGLSDEEAAIMLKNNYKLDEALYSEDEVRAAKIQLKIAGDTAKGYLQSLQASFETPKPAEPAPQETQEQIAERARAYEAGLAPVLTSIEQELPGLFSKVNVNGGKDDKAITLELPIPADIQTEIVNQVKGFAVSNQVDISVPENAQALKDYASNLTKIKMFDSWAIDIASKREAAIREEFNNPDTIKRDQVNPAAPSTNSRQATASKVADSF